MGHFFAGVRFTELSNELSERIGPIYLLRLGAVQEQRILQLRALILQCPEPHEATPQCYIEGQNNLLRTWGHIAAELAYQIRAGNYCEPHLLRSDI